MLYPHEWHKPGPIRKRNKAVRKARQRERERRREKEREGERRREKEREGERSKEKQREAKRSKEKQEREGERRREKEREGERRREKEREGERSTEGERSREIERGKKNYNRHKLVILRAPNHLWNLGLCPGSRHQTWTKANWFRVSTGGSQGISGYTMDGNPSRDNGHQQRSVPLTNTMRPTMWEGHW